MLAFLMVAVFQEFCM